MKIRIRTYKDEIQTLEANTALEVIPYQYVMTSPHVKRPYEGILYYKGKILPVTGPLPAVWEKSTDYNNTPWILVCKDHARVILGLPVADEKAHSNSTVPDQMDFDSSISQVDEDAIALALEEAIARIA